MSISQPTFVDYRVWRADKQANLFEDVADHLQNMKVSINQDATDSPWKLTGDMDNPELFQRLFDYVIPELRFAYSDGTTSGWRRLGHYRVKSIPRSHPSSGSLGSFVGKDLTAVISRIQVTTPTTIAAATNVTTWLTTALTTTLGFTAAQVGIPDIVKTPSLAVTYEAGTSWLTIIDNTLESVAYRHLYMNAAGLLTTSVSQELTSLTPSAIYDDGDVIGVPTEDPDDSRVRNLQTVRRVTPGSPTISYTAMNMDSSSPLRIDGPLGQLAGQAIDDPQLADADAAEIRAKFELSYGSSFYNKATVAVIPRLDIDLYQVVGLDLYDIRKRVQLSGSWLQRTVEFPIGPPIADMARGMILGLNRVQPFVSGGDL